MNTTSTDDGLPKFDPSAKNIAILITLSIIVLLTIVGNLVVLIAFVKEPKLRNEAFNYFIFNLAITDFLIALTAMTFYTIDTILGYWPFGPAVCAFWIYADYAMTFASVFTLSAISVDRFWSVTWPIHYRVHATIRKTIIMIAIVWVSVFIIWTPPFIGDRLKHNEEHICIWEPNENREFIIVVDVIGHYLPCLLMVVSYFKVCWVMRHRMKVGVVHRYGMSPGRSTMASRIVTVSSENPHSTMEKTAKTNGGNRLQESTIEQPGPSTLTSSPNRLGKQDLKPGKPGQEDTRYNKVERKIFITLSYVVSSYLICWFPFYVTWDIYAFHPDLVPPLLYTIMFWMTYLNSTLNPFIYAYTNKDFRRAFWRIIRCKF